MIKNLQFIIRNELINAQKIFGNVGGAGILMNINNGEILSLVSVPDFDLNKGKIYQMLIILIVQQRAYMNLDLFLNHLQLQLV